MKMLNQGKSLIGISGIADNAKIWLGHQHRLEPFTYHFVVVNDEQANHSGTAAFTINPPSSPFIRKNCPPSSSTLLCIPLRPRCVALLRYILIICVERPIPLSCTTNTACSLVTCTVTITVVA